VGLSLAHLAHLEGAIATLDTEVDQVISPFAGARDQLDTITGVGKRAAETIIADMRRRHGGVPHRRAPGKLGWALPGQQPHRGQAPPGRPTTGNRWLAEVLTEGAWAAAAQPRHLPGRPVLAAGPTHRQQAGGHGRGSLDPGDRLAPTRQ
jgi:transposase